MTYMSIPSEPDRTPAGQERRESLGEGVDAILDEIDDVLEENAEDFRDRAARDTSVAGAESEDPLRPAIRRLLIHDNERSTALAAGIHERAQSALSDVVDDLNGLLDSVVVAIKGADNVGTRARVKENLSNLLAISSLKALPLGDVAQLLDIPREQADTIVHDLNVYGGPNPEALDIVLSRIEDLRAELHRIAADHRITAEWQKHTLLDKLVSLIGKLALAISIATASGSLAAVAVGDDVIVEIVKSGVAALIALALNASVNALINHRRERNPYVVANAAHGRLLGELRKVDNVPTGGGRAYESETTVMQTRVLVAIYLAQKSLLGIEWAQKITYWTTLDDIADLVSVSDNVRPDLAHLRLRLESFHIPLAS